jgi:hypothetical protein
MKVKTHIVFFSSIFPFLLQANAQKKRLQNFTDSLLVAKIPVNQKIERYGIRFGVDLFKLTRSFL